MYHSITIGNKNTWDDWYLIPSSRPLFSPPAPKTVYVDVPGADSSLDLSDVLTGYPTYSNREGSIEFYVMHDHWLEAGKNWADCYSELMAYLHGRNYRAVLEDDPDFYYEGKFKVDDWKSNNDYSTISINYNLSPYKYSKYMTSREFQINGDTTVKMDLGDAANCVPTIKVNNLTGDFIQITKQHRDDETGYKDTSTYDIVLGDNKIPTLFLTRGMNTYILSGYGDVTFEYRERRL